MFKITLPCSGKLTDEVDVQVLINIAGLVPLSSDAAANEYTDGTAALDSTAAGTPTQEQQADYQLARAVHAQQNELLNQAGGNLSLGGSSSSTTSGTTSPPAGSQQGDQMQADEAAGSAGKMRAPMRHVSHTIAIKRKKICTMHPVPVPPVPSRAPDMIRPPNQPPVSESSVVTPPGGGGNKWPSPKDSGAAQSQQPQQVSV